MSTEQADPGPRPTRAWDGLEESMASTARIAPRRRHDGEGDPRSGGDPSKAPHSLSETELGPSDGASSGVSWDDPDEL